MRRETEYQSCKSFVDDEIFLLPRKLKAIDTENCRLLPDRYQLIAHMPRNALVAEIGTQAGVFAKHIYETSQPKRLYLFDKSFQQVSHPFDHAYFLGPSKQGVVELHEGNSSDMLAKFPEQYFDWIYIDGDHSFDGVSKDALAADAALKNYGYLLFNDYTIYSPFEKIQYGVPRVVNDLILDNNYKLVYFAFSIDGYHDVCLKKEIK